MPTAPTHHYKPRRSVWFKGEDGYLHTTKYRDERIVYKLDFSDRLDDSETLSTVSTVGGPTINSSSVSGAVLTLDVSGIGVLDVTLTTSGTGTIKRTYVFEGIDASINDYG